LIFVRLTVLRLIRCVRSGAPLTEFGHLPDMRVNRRS
jgi:hypothetical protein